MINPLPSFGGDNIAARASGALTQWLGIFAALLVTVILVVIVINRVWKALHLDNGAARQKTRTTTAADIKTAAEALALNTAETGVLGDLCRHERTPNINYFFLDSAKTYAFFQRAYLRLKDAPGSLSAFFSLFEKVNRFRLMHKGPRTMAVLPKGLQVLVLDPKGPQWSTTLVDRDSGTMTLTAPRRENGEIVRLKEMSKVTVMAEGPEDAAITAAVRVLRYQQSPQGQEEIVLTQTTDVQTFTRQNYAYVQCDRQCTYAVCRESVEEQEDGSASTSYIPEDTKYRGTVINYTAKNCNLLLESGFDPGVFVLVQADMGNGTSGEIVVQTVQKAPQGDRWLVHCRLVYAKDSIKNYMLARVNGFESG